MAEPANAPAMAFNGQFRWRTVDGRAPTAPPPPEPTTPAAVYVATTAGLERVNYTLVEALEREVRQRMRTRGADSAFTAARFARLVRDTFEPTVRTGAALNTDRLFAFLIVAFGVSSPTSESAPPLSDAVRTVFGALPYRLSTEQPLQALLEFDDAAPGRVRVIGANANAGVLSPLIRVTGMTRRVANPHHERVADIIATLQRRISELRAVPSTTATTLVTPYAMLWPSEDDTDRALNTVVARLPLSERAALMPRLGDGNATTRGTAASAAGVETRPVLRLVETMVWPPRMRRARTDFWRRQVRWWTATWALASMQRQASVVTSATDDTTAVDVLAREQAYVYGPLLAAVQSDIDDGRLSFDDVPVTLEEVMWHSYDYLDNLYALEYAIERSDVDEVPSDNALKALVERQRHVDELARWLRYYTPGAEVGARIVADWTRAAVVVDFDVVVVVRVGDGYRRDVLPSSRARHALTAVVVPLTTLHAHVDEWLDASTRLLRASTPSTNGGDDAVMVATLRRRYNDTSAYLFWWSRGSSSRDIETLLQRVYAAWSGVVPLQYSATLERQLEHYRLALERITHHIDVPLSATVVRGTGGSDGGVPAPLRAEATYTASEVTAIERTAHTPLVHRFTLWRYHASLPEGAPQVVERSDVVRWPTVTFETQVTAPGVYWYVVERISTASDANGARTATVVASGRSTQAIVTVHDQCRRTHRAFDVDARASTSAHWRTRLLPPLPPWARALVVANSSTQRGALTRRVDVTYRDVMARFAKLTPDVASLLRGGIASGEMAATDDDVVVEVNAALRGVTSATLFSSRRGAVWLNLMVARWSPLRRVAPFGGDETRVNSTHRDELERYRRSVVERWLSAYTIVEMALVATADHATQEHDVTESLERYVAVLTLDDDTATDTRRTACTRRRRRRRHVRTMTLQQLRDAVAVSVRVDTPWKRKALASALERLEHGTVRVVRAELSGAVEYRWVGAHSTKTTKEPDAFGVTLRFRVTERVTAAAARVGIDSVVAVCDVDVLLRRGSRTLDDAHFVDLTRTVVDAYHQVVGGERSGVAPETLHVAYDGTESAEVAVGVRVPESLARLVGIVTTTSGEYAVTNARDMTRLRTAFQLRALGRPILRDRLDSLAVALERLHTYVATMVVDSDTVA